MYPRLLKPSGSQSYFLLGPRGTGKTRWVRHYYPTGLYLDLLQSSLYTELLAYPDRLETLISPDFVGWVILDEIQRIPQLLNEVHRLIENRGLRFVLTGSSARSLRRHGINLLGGRARMEHMHPLAAVELGDAFNLTKALQMGLMPTVWDRPDDPTLYLSGYLESYLQHEVAQEGVVRQLGDFARFLKVASLSQAQPLNVANVAREVALSRDRVVGYFQIVEDLLIATQIPPFTRRAERRLVMHPKFFFFDAGLYRILRPRGPLDTTAEVDGAALETLLLQNLRAVIDGLHLGYDISYWRTVSGLEIDFVLYGPLGLHAIEVKRSRTLGPKDLSSLQAFRKNYSEATCWILYGGEQRQYFDNITAVPFAEFLMHLPTLLGKV